MSTVALATLGCKVNQCESAYLEEKLTQADFLIRPFTAKADLYCINTCAVTSRAAMQSRQLIRRALRQNPEAEVVVMGCYSQIAAEEIAAIPGVTHILGFCSYCIVPYARGRSRSINLESVLDQVARFLDRGYQEVVLTGIHLGQWGLDFKPRQDLIDLLRSIIEHCPPPRLRLSSLEPGEITSDLLELIANEPSLCPHLHIPLQSGDATILSRMNRRYHPDFYRELVLEATQRIPDLAVGADVLVGFPGETDECFQNSYRLIESLPIAYLHVFPYSPRPTTPAATMNAQVSPSVIRQRCGLLRELDQAKRLTFLQRFSGEMRQVLVENRRDEASSMQCGFTDNYLPVLVPADSALENQVVMARLDRLEGNRLVAIPV